MLVDVADIVGTAKAAVTHVGFCTGVGVHVPLRGCSSVGSTMGDSTPGTEYRGPSTRNAFGSLNEAYYQGSFTFANT